MKLRPPSIPLVTVDPFFSIWSMENELNTDFTRHWTGRTFPMTAGVVIDGKYYAVMGTDNPDTLYKLQNNEYVFNQDSVEVTPLFTHYTFSNDICKVKLSFVTPLLLDRLDILSRTASYIEYDVEVIDGKDHEVMFTFGIAAECAVDNCTQEVVFGKTEGSVYCGNKEQKILNRSGDRMCIDWGYLHVADTDAKIVNVSDGLITWVYKPMELDINGTYVAMKDNPYIWLEKKELSGVITLGYDEVKPIEYFDVQLDEYYKKYYASFDDMLKAAKDEYYEIKALCEKFDESLLREGKKYGEKYLEMISVGYRQAISAHKLVEDTEGNILFLSKENYSNGCIGTLDVTYPSIPLFLKYNPELVLGMLRPIIKYAHLPEWTYDFAPHDVGQYPLANGQAYGGYPHQGKKGDTPVLEKQMPVEECGNMLICVAAAAHYSKDNSFAMENAAILKKWADYLVEYGYNPGNQLCTDDFAGHLAQNCNLSVKAIVALACYGRVFEDAKYTDLAKKMASDWVKDSKGSDGTRLAFDKDGTWSLKYNMVWDKILDLGLWDKSVYDAEIKTYISKMNKYGVPLDSRSDYTKTDWEIWATVLCEDDSFLKLVTDRIWDMLNETKDRAPFADWYYSSTATLRCFRCRSVIGGIYINLI